MESALLLVGLVIVAFSATNLDNLLLLVGFVARPGQPFAAVVSGMLLSGGVMLALCSSVALAAGLAPVRWLGWLGVVPLVMGLRELQRLASSSAAEAEEPETGMPPLTPFAVAGVMLANSADSFGALVPLFAESRPALLPLIGAVVVAMSLLACLLARWITSHRRIGPAIRSIAPRLVPFVLILVGLYVLSDTTTDTLL